MDERLLREFLAEAEDLIEELYGDVAELRERRGEGPARRELVARTFRHVHTVKGTAAAAGLDPSGRVAHEFESLLDAVRRGGTPLDEEALDACEEAVGALAESLDAAARGAEWTVPARLFERLRRLAAQTPVAAADARAAAEELLPPEVARALTAPELGRLAEAVAEGARAYLVSVEFDLSDFDGQYKRLSESLKESGEVVSTQPFVSDVGPGRVGFRIVYASAEAFTKLAERAAVFGATLVAAKTAAGSSDKTFEKTRDGTLESSEASEAAPLATTNTTSSTSTSVTGVRVTLEELDELISTTHGLFADTLGALELALAGAAERPALEERARGVRRSFFELEERLIDRKSVV